MTESQKQKIVSCARGTWQAQLAQRLADGRTISSWQYGLRGKAKNFSSSYRNSFSSLLSRLNEAGFTVHRTAGIRGGEYTATYRIVFEK